MSCKGTVRRLILPKQWSIYPRMERKQRWRHLSIIPEVVIKKSMVFLLPVWRSNIWSWPAVVYVFLHHWKCPRLDLSDFHRSCRLLPILWVGGWSLGLGWQSWPPSHFISHPSFKDIPSDLSWQPCQNRRQSHACVSPRQIFSPILKADLVPWFPTFGSDVQCDFQWPWISKRITFSCFFHVSGESSLTGASSCPLVPHLLPSSFIGDVTLLAS